MPRRVAAIFAHPDDETLGAGGALALHAARGDEVQILLLATGLTARAETEAPALATLRGQAEAAAKKLGAASVSFADFPDNAMDTVPLLDVIKRVENFLADFEAETIYTHHGCDLNIDHRITQQAVVTACRPLPGVGSTEILGCEVNSSTEWAVAPAAPFMPNEFVDIADVLDRKVAALECYEDEIRPWPHPRSAEGVRTLARWRGAQCGREAAEAFQVIRRVRGGL